MNDKIEGVLRSESLETPSVIRDNRRFVKRAFLDIYKNWNNMFSSGL